MNDLLEPIKKLSRDLRAAAIDLSDDEARFLVDYYYMTQDDRKRAHNQERALEEGGKPHSVITFLANQSQTLESQIKRALDTYSNSKAIGQWARSVTGIGPIIAAGLMAYINLNPWRCRREDKKAKGCRPHAPCTPACDHEILHTVGHIWRYAGLDPTVKWEKGQLRPWNAGLKTLCWKIGESFVKVKGNPNDIYGKIYDQRKALETLQNDQFAYANQAALILTARPTHKQKDAYSVGKLPLGHIHARAKRYTIKLFLSHWHEIAYREQFGIAPPLPYPIAILGHGHLIKPIIKTI